MEDVTTNPYPEFTKITNLKIKEDNAL